MRIDVLFPEAFPSGSNDITVEVCYSCHRKADRLIPHGFLLTPEKLSLLHNMLSSGELVTVRMVKEWIKDSYPEIRRRRKNYLIAKKALFKTVILFLAVFVYKRPVKR